MRGRLGKIVFAAAVVALTASGAVARETSDSRDTKARESDRWSKIRPEMVRIPAGLLRPLDRIGNANSPDSEAIAIGEFFLGKYEVTVWQFRAFVASTGYKTEVEKKGSGWVFVDGKWMNIPDASWSNPYFEQSDAHPVSLVSWNDARAYCEWLSTQTGRAYRLPTEVEWEHAASLGGKNSHATNSGRWNATMINGIGTNEKDIWPFTSPVGSFPPNRLGLHDMSGNLWEWCSDWYDPERFGRRQPGEFRLSSETKLRSLRGGAWTEGEAGTRTTLRDGGAPWKSHSYNGFRVAADLVE